MPIDKGTKLGESLKKLREEKNLTQEDISEILKVKRQTYSAWERNVSIPDITTVNFLADYYGVSIDYILGKVNVRPSLETRAAHHDGGDRFEESAFTEEDIVNAVVGKIGTSNDVDSYKYELAVKLIAAHTLTTLRLLYGETPGDEIARCKTICAVYEATDLIKKGINDRFCTPENSPPP